MGNFLTSAIYPLDNPEDATIVVLDEHEEEIDKLAKEIGQHYETTGKLSVSLWDILKDPIVRQLIKDLLIRIIKKIIDNKSGP